MTDAPNWPPTVDLDRLTPPERLGAAIHALGAKTVRPVLEDGGSPSGAARTRHTGGPWWDVLSEALEAMEAEDGAERTRRLLSGEWEAAAPGGPSYE